MRCEHVLRGTPTESLTAQRVTRRLHDGEQIRPVRHVRVSLNQQNAQTLHNGGVVALDGTVGERCVRGHNVVVNAQSLRQLTDDGRREVSPAVGVQHVKHSER